MGRKFLRQNISSLKLIAVLILVLYCGFYAGNGLAEKHEGHAGHGTAAILTSVDLEIKPSEPIAGKETAIIFSLKNAEGKPLKGLTISHERMLHVIIISADFKVFAHIHPEDFSPVTDDMIKKAEFKVTYTFPKSGKYILAVDYAVKDSSLHDSFIVDVAGSPAMAPVTKDFSKKKKIGDYEITLATMPERIKAGKATILRYVISRNGKKVTDLEPYLSAPMHAAVIMTDFNNFLHAHGELPGDSNHISAGHAHGAVPKKFGPVIEVSLLFPAKGAYAIFSEIKHNGKVIPFNFMVMAE